MWKSSPETIKFKKFFGLASSNYQSIKIWHVDGITVLWFEVATISPTPETLITREKEIV